MSLFKRQLNKNGKDITLHNRAIVAPAGGEVDFDMSFTTPTPVRALLCTQRGTTLFDGVATDRLVTHLVKIEYMAGVTAETWVQLADGRRLDVLDVENCCEDNTILKLLCAETGANKASEA